MTLERIQKILEQEEYECTWTRSSEGIPLDSLHVFLGVDNKRRERMLEITSFSQPLSPELTRDEGTPFPARVRFRIELPFKIKDLALNQVASLILFLNQYIDLPGFELNELEGTVYYRYVLLVHPDHITKILMMSILGAAILNLSLFSEMIESLADGKVTFNDLLAQILRMQAPENQS
jgi:hypothetical protein